MTRKERAEVVELLRCAADCCGKTWGPFGMACDGLDVTPGNSVRDLASEAAQVGLQDALGEDWWRAGYLEAAQRVEDNEWP